jgi:hypothetical protein
MSYVSKVPKLDHTFINFEFSPFYITVTPDVKASSFKEFKALFIDALMEDERASMEDDYGEIGDYTSEDWYSFCMKCLGEEKYKKHIEKLLCTPLIGEYKDIYINMSPYFISSKPNYCHLRLKGPPTMIKIFYLHSKMWQRYYRKHAPDHLKDDGSICHHYSCLRIKGDRYTLIVDVGIDS